MTPSEFAAQLLADPGRSGIYRSASPWASVAGAPISARPLAPVSLDREGLLAALGEGLAFPDYYGQNWDAAWDCLTELDWPAGQLLLVRLPIAGECAVDEAALEIFLELLADACQHWGGQGRALCLLVESSREDLACLSDLPRLD
jgi:hypothetical protein